MKTSMSCVLSLRAWGAPTWNPDPSWSKTCWIRSLQDTGPGDAKVVKGVVTRCKNQKVAGVTPWRRATSKDFTRGKGPPKEICVIKAQVRQLKRDLSVKLTSIWRPSGKSLEKRALDLTIWQVFSVVGKSTAAGGKPDQVEEWTGGGEVETMTTHDFQELLMKVGWATGKELDGFWGRSIWVLVCILIFEVEVHWACCRLRGKDIQV